MPAAPPNPSAATAPAGPVSGGEPEIHVIPDKFYGVALKARVEERAVAPQTGAPAKSRWPWIVMIIVVLVLGIGGGFLYFNYDLLFPPPAPPVPAPVAVETPKPLPPPSAPTGASATSTNPQSAILNWTDTSANETGFRIERKAGDAAYATLTSLPANSTSFLDSSVAAGTIYAYRVTAVNASGASDPSNEANVTVPSLPPPPPEQPKLPPAGLDSDSDGLTDLEETLYGSDPRNPDTEGDVFLDGNEVYNLYDSTKKAPARLADSSIVKVFTAPVGWVMYVPSAWSVTPDAADASKATVDTRHGETFIVAIEENPEKKPILQWYLDAHPGVNPTQVMEYRSKGGYRGILGVDQLTTYIPWGDRVFTFTYELDGQSFVNYRTTYYMMLNSLMLAGMTRVSPLPPGAVLPFEPSATTSGVIAQPVPAVTATSSQNAATSTP